MRVRGRFAQPPSIAAFVAIAVLLSGALGVLSQASPVLSQARAYTFADGQQDLDAIEGRFTGDISMGALQRKGLAIDALVAENRGRFFSSRDRDAFDLLANARRAINQAEIGLVEASANLGAEGATARDCGDAAASRMVATYYAGVGAQVEVARANLEAMAKLIPNVTISPDSVLTLPDVLRGEDFSAVAREMLDWTNRVCVVESGQATGVGAEGLSRDDVARLVREQLLDPQGEAAVYVWPERVSPGDRVAARDRRVWPLGQIPRSAAIQDAWFAWIDDQPSNPRFGHDTRFVFADRSTGAYAVVPADWWPTINDQQVWDTSDARDSAPERIIAGDALSPAKPEVAAGSEEARPKLTASAASATPGDIAPHMVYAASVPKVDTLTGSTCPIARHYAAILVLDRDFEFRTEADSVGQFLSTFEGGMPTFRLRPQRPNEELPYSPFQPGDPRYVPSTWYVNGDQERQRKEVENFMAGVGRQLQPCDTLFLYVIAHAGLSDYTAKEKINGQWVKVHHYDTNMGAMDITGADLADMIARNIHCCQLTVVLQACHAGAAISHLRPVATTIVAASTADQVSKGSKFTDHFIERLKNGDDLYGATHGDLFAGNPFFTQTPIVEPGARVCPCVCIDDHGQTIWVTVTPTPSSTSTREPTLTPPPTQTPTATLDMPAHCRFVLELFTCEEPTAIRNIYVGGYGGQTAPPPPPVNPFPTLTPEQTSAPTEITSASPTATTGSTPAVSPTQTARVVPPTATPTRTSTPTTASPSSTPTPSPTPTTGSTSQTIGVGSSPYGVAVDALLNHAYVANSLGGTVSVIDGSANTIIANVPVGSGPMAVAANATTHHVFVTNPGANTVPVIDGNTNAVATVVPEANAPFAVDVDPTRNLVYVVRNLSGHLQLVDGATNTPVNSVFVGNNPVAVAVDPITGNAYVVNYTDCTLAVVNGAGLTVLQTIPLGNNPAGVAVNPQTHRVYASNFTDGTVSVVNTLTSSVVTTVHVGNHPDGVAVAPSTNRVYVANSGSGTVSVIDGATNGVVRTVSVGAGPAQVAVDDIRHRVYVTNQNANSVTVFTD